MGNNNLLKLPGLIDPHVHLRDPGSTEKEDFFTGTCAAVAGGYTAIIDMPNNPHPITSEEALSEKISLASRKIVCDVGFHFGASPSNYPVYKQIEAKVKGLKLYLNQTTGPLLIKDLEAILNIFQHWPGQKPILVHAEGVTVAMVLVLSFLYRKPVHFCHISQKSEIELIKKAKEQGFSVTCEVTPHHLFLTQEDVKRLGGFGIMKPPLPSKRDQEALWENLAVIDLVASDHAPHTLAEKQSPQPPFGVPGLETTLPLLLTAVSEKRLTLERLVELTFLNPSRIFKIQQDPATSTEVDPQESYFIQGSELKTKCRWSPFQDWRVCGRVRRVTLRGQIVFEGGQVLVPPGFGRILY
jgi:carbamoyl-phosphate synthase/aspartate carbamoyltransferase/dihydroorotase